MLPRNEVYPRVGRLSSPGLTLEPREELPNSVITWTVPYKQLSTDQQRAAWFMDGSFNMNRQHSVWKATTLMEKDKNKSAW